VLVLAAGALLDDEGIERLAFNLMKRSVQRSRRRDVRLARGGLARRTRLLPNAALN
jgi:hypothetical protein